jgi:Tol biopolymer transport system component
VFESSATNLVRKDTNGYADVFVRDLKLDTTTRVSVSSSGRQANADAGFGAPGVVSGDGRFVVFESDASNLVRHDTNGVGDVFVWDAATARTVRVSLNTRDRQANAASRVPSMSRDGRYVSFSSDATNLVPNDGNGVADVFVRTVEAGRTSRVSVSTGGVEGDGGGGYASISAHGRYVAFDSFAANLVANDGNHVTDVFVHDLRTGRTRRASLSRSGDEGDGESRYPFISSDGRFVVFQSDATNLVANDANGTTDIYVRGSLT